MKYVPPDEKNRFRNELVSNQRDGQIRKVNFTKRTWRGVRHYATTVLPPLR